MHIVTQIVILTTRNRWGIECCVPEVHGVVEVFFTRRPFHFLFYVSASPFFTQLLAPRRLAPFSRGALPLGALPLFHAATCPSAPCPFFTRRLSHESRRDCPKVAGGVSPRLAVFRGKAPAGAAEIIRGLQGHHTWPRHPPTPRAPRRGYAASRARGSRRHRRGAGRPDRPPPGWAAGEPPGEAAGRSVAMTMM